MKVSLRLKEILSYCDGPEVVILQNREIGYFVGTIDYPDSGSPEWLAVPTHPRQIQKLISGAVDLKTIVLSSARYGWYSSRSDQLTDAIEFEPHYNEDIPEHLVPGESISYSFSETSDMEVLREASERDNFVARIHIEHQDIARRHRLDLGVYEQILSRLRKIIRVATKLASDGETLSNSLSTALDISASPTAGSVVLWLEAQNPAEGFSQFDPYFELHRALKYITTKIKSTSDSAGQSLQSYPQNFARNIIDLYTIIQKSDIEFSVSWSDPSSMSSGQGGVSRTSAAEIVDYLRSNSDIALKQSDETIEGSFVRVNKDSRTWGLDTKNGLVKGKLNSGLSKSVLDGLVVGELYRFECIRRISTGDAVRGKDGELFLREPPTQVEE